MSRNPNDLPVVEHQAPLNLFFNIDLCGRLGLRQIMIFDIAIERSLAVKKITDLIRS
jgi:hypothetical protein